jgi:hypothetical protein
MSGEKHRQRERVSERRREGRERGRNREWKDEVMVLKFNK